MISAGSKMNAEELVRRISRGENLHTEFKENVENPESLAKSIVCFANTDGGQIIVGVSRNGEIIGVKDLDYLERLVDDVAFNGCEPPVTVVVETVEVEGKIVLVINVPKGEQRPYRTKRGLYYIRSASRCRLASREELLRLFQSSESIFYDETEVWRASIQDLNLSSVSEFLRRYWGITVPVGSPELKIYMRNLSIISKNEKPTLAGLLFFGEDPQRFLPHARIVAAYIHGDDISTPPFDRKDLVGRAPDMLENAMKFLKLYLREEHRIKGMESELYPEIPDEALREALINAIAHRDYTINAPIRILIFSNRVEFHSPGRLPNTVSIESIRMGASHVLRNPRIYSFFVRMGLVTDIGSGVARIIKLVKESTGKDVILEETEGEFILVMPRRGQ
jgi:ATP-dependent DNA helicase RecG